MTNISRSSFAAGIRLLYQNRDNRSAETLQKPAGPTATSASDSDSTHLNASKSHSPATLHYELNAEREPALLERHGQFKAAHRIVEELAQTASPKPNEMKVAVTVPEERWLSDLETGLRKLNHVAQPSGIVGQFKQKAFRLRTGLQGPLPPVRYERDTAEPDRTMHLSVNLSTVQPEDVVKFASFLRGHIGK